MSVGGLASFGHAAYFGLGAYGVALLAKLAGLPMIACLLLGPLLGLLGAAVFGFFAVQLSGVYFAMLTLAFAQIVWSIAFQWVDVTGGDNGILGIWPEKWASSPSHFYWLAIGVAALAVAALRIIVFSPFGFALRATRDSPLRGEAVGIDGKRIQWTAFVIFAASLHFLMSVGGLASFGHAAYFGLGAYGVAASRPSPAPWSAPSSTRRSTSGW